MIPEYKFVVDNSKYVSINYNKIDSFVNEINSLEDFIHPEILVQFPIKSFA